MATYKVTRLANTDNKQMLSEILYHKSDSRGGTLFGKSLDVF